MGRKDKISRILETERIGLTRIEIVNNKTIIVEGCYGISEFGEEMIKVNMPKGTLTILGNNLEICLMEERGVTASGKILSLEFEGGAE